MPLGGRKSDMVEGDLAKMVMPRAQKAGHCVPFGATARVLSISKGLDVLYQLEGTAHALADGGVDLMEQKQRAPGRIK